MPVMRLFTYQAGIQFPLDAATLNLLYPNACKNSLFIPFFAFLASCVILLIQTILAAWQTRRENASYEATTHLVKLDRRTYSGRFARVFRFADEHGGFVILACKVERFLGSAGLLGFSLYDLLREENSYSLGRLLEPRNLPQLGLVITYWYTTILSAFALIPNTWSQTVTRHTNFVLFAAFSTYVYRDLWPLATFTEQPLDLIGPILYAKMSLLTLTAVLIPLFVPRRYIPVDPEHPMEVPNPEQTASVFSLAVYTFLDSIIMEAYRVPHLSHEKLPPLCDYDRSKRLTSDAFPHLDPFVGAKKDRHIFWGLMSVFFWEYVVMGVCLIGMNFAQLVSPIAVNRILVYLESPNPVIFIRPWFWVSTLFAGPIIGSLFFQWYIFVGTRTLARVQAILTELIFEHGLRIRLKAEASGDSSSSPGTRAQTPVGEPSTSDASSVADNRSPNTSATTLAEGSDGDTSDAAKGKAKAEPVKKETAAQQPKKKDNLVGKINTLVTVDVDRIAESKDFLMVLLLVPLELATSMAFLYIVLGWSAFVGLASIIILLPVPGYLASKLQNINTKKMEKTDARVEDVTQTIGVLRMVKLFGWERKMSEKLQQTRDEEMHWIYKEKLFYLFTSFVNFLVPTVSMVVTYATYTIVAKQALTRLSFRLGSFSSKVFSSLPVFDGIRNLMHRTNWFFTDMIRGKVSLDRVGKFLRETELLDNYSEGTCTEINANFTPKGDESSVGFNDAIFAWSKDAEDGMQTPSSRSYRLKVPGRVEFKPNALNLIVGPTGSGKTSVLMALLGEMHFMPSGVDSWYNLPRNRGIAYAAQESWVQNETIRDNILFGAPYDEERYQKVLHQCALEPDLKLFEAGDKTEVGEKGLTLSGGQKARVTLARAVYSPAQIILLDDILAALDVHTSKYIVRECLQGDLLHDRTILLVTHNVALTSPIAAKIIAVGLDGVAQEVSNISEVIGMDERFAAEVEKEQDENEVEKEVIDEVKKGEKEADGKLILAEDIEEGHVSWTAIKLFLKALGGNYPVFFMSIWIGGQFLNEGCNLFSVWFLGFWGQQYQDHDPSEVSTAHYLGEYSAILGIACVIYAITEIFYIIGTQRASRTINVQLIDSMLSATFRWLDATPASRIITRCTQDIGVIDGTLHQMLAAVVSIFVSMVVKLGGPVFFSPIFLLPGVLIGLLGAYIGNIYLKAQMSVKREMSNARAPVLAHFGAAITGLVSIRAYDAQLSFRTESYKRIDHFTKISRSSYNLNRWIGIRTDLLGASFTAALAAYLLAKKTINASNTGFSLNMSIEFCSMIIWLVRCYNEFEVKANSLERIQAYLEIDHEPKPSAAGVPPAAWPTSGELQVEKMSARYSALGPKVLHDLSFHVKSGERIGIVGRTGSGKSSLTLSLLRCILTEGNVFYDGIPSNQLNLDVLRSNVTIIPQVPELLSGTLRRNLDPFEQHDDATLNAALRAAGLFSLQTEADEARLTLDSDISGGGTNLSVGQRQIIALARAMVRNSKLLILDEATSAIDHKTDAIIQATLRNELGSDTTVLTIAHRLQTIMDADKIMVLDSGRIVEYDSPQTLLQKKGGHFKALVDGSGDRKALYAAAEQNTSRNSK